MNAPYVTEIPKFLLVALNQMYDMERKLALHGDTAGVSRNVQRVKDAFAEGGLFYEDPMGQSFSETRTDLEVSIAGEGTDNLKVAEVIKPVIRYGDTAYSRVIQKGIVVVRSETAPPPGAPQPPQAQE
jgi:hypothetical protein